MSGNALFGRYWPADSAVHKLDPRTKVLGTLFVVVAIFCAGNAAGLALVAAFLVAVVLVARIPLAQALRSIAPLLFIVVLTGLFNLLFVQGGQVYVDWGWLRISEEGTMLATFVSARLLLLLLAGSLLTLTTTSMDITEAIERLLQPLAHIGVPTHEFAFVMGTALRFLPQFAEEFRQIRIAQVARGRSFPRARCERGSRPSPASWCRCSPACSAMPTRCPTPWRRAATTGRRDARGCIRWRSVGVTRWPRLCSWPCLPRCCC